jgi:hypothetical protein
METLEIPGFPIAGCDTNTFLGAEQEQPPQELQWTCT